MLPRSVLGIPAETNRVVQVKYTNPSNSDVAHCLVTPTCGQAGKYAFGSGRQAAVTYQLLRSKDVSFSLSGSNQAREGRLVNALAARGDERRDTLR